MSRPPVFPAEEKIRIVLSILAGETTIAHAARQAKVSETSGIPAAARDPEHRSR